MVIYRRNIKISKIRTAQISVVSNILILSVQRLRFFCKIRQQNRTLTGRLTHLKTLLDVKTPINIEMTHFVGLDPILLQSRIRKAVEEQQERTRK